MPAAVFMSTRDAEDRQKRDYVHVIPTRTA